MDAEAGIRQSTPEASWSASRGTVPLKRLAIAVLTESARGLIRISMRSGTVGLVVIRGRHRRVRQRCEHRKRKFFRFNSQLAHHAKILPFFGLRENQKRRTFFLCPTGPPYPMDIGIRIDRQLVMNHLRDIGNIQPSRGYIGGHQ